MSLRAITARQPHAGLIAAGLKLVENRAAMTNLRGELAIHAGKTPDLDELFRVQQSGLAGPFTVLGAVLAVADLVGCHLADQDTTDTCCAPYGRRLHNDRAAYHLLLANVRRLQHPVECRGQLGVGWPIPADVERSIRQQLSPTA